MIRTVASFLLFAAFELAVASFAQVGTDNGQTTIVPAIDVFLIAGQSNGQGMGTAGPTVPPEVKQYYRGTISVANDPVGNAMTGSAWPAFGLTYHEATKRSVLVVPRAEGGTPQTSACQAGDRNWDASGSLVAAAISTINAALAAANTAGYVPIFKGVLWSQGEQDGGCINQGVITEDDYRTSLNNMISRFRPAFGTNMPFYIFRTGTSYSKSDFGYSRVRGVQEAVASTDPHTIIVYRKAIDFKALGWMKADGVHYSQAGLDDMGAIGAANIVTAMTRSN